MIVTRVQGIVKGVSIATIGLLLSLPLSGGDFIRGDANGDGVVSFADAYRILGFISQRLESPDCMDAADADDNGIVDYFDSRYVWNYVVYDAAPPAPPFPALGPDVTPAEGLDCQSFGGGSSIEDPLAKLQVLDAVVPGGDDERVSLRVALSNGRPLAGLVGILRLGGAEIGGLHMGLGQGDLTGMSPRLEVAVLEDGPALGFALLSRTALSADPDVSTWYAPGSDVPILELSGCLEYGTPAGEYQLTLESVELMDAESGRAIRPALQSGILMVGAEVSAHCNDHLPGPTEPKAVLTLESGNVAVGERVVIPLTIRADGPVEGYSYSVDFDEEVLYGNEVAVVWQRPDGQSYDFQYYDINNDSNRPGSHGVDEGFIVGAAVFDWENADSALMPAATDNDALDLIFSVSANATNELTEIRFLNGGRGSQRPGPVHNAVTVGGSGVEIEFVHSLLTLQQVGKMFSRGDANGDGTINISDAVTTLGYLFSGDQVLRCRDAADANDDGVLNISDPIVKLSYLFLGGASLPEPFGACGADPTQDGLGCATSVNCP